MIKGTNGHDPDSVPMLTGVGNYPQWEIRMTIFLKRRGLWNVIDSQEDADKTAKPIAVMVTSSTQTGESNEVLQGPADVESHEDLMILSDTDENQVSRDLDAVINDTTGADYFAVEQQRTEQLERELEDLRFQNQALDDIERSKRIEEAMERGRLIEEKIQLAKKEQEEHQRREEEASWLIMCNVEPSIVARIRSLSSAREMWNVLQVLHMGTEPDQLWKTYHKLYFLNYRHCADMQEYVDTFMGIVTKLSHLGRPLQHSLAIFHLFEGLKGMHAELRRRFDLEQEFETISLKDLCNQLLEEEKSNKRKSLKASSSLSREPMSPYRRFQAPVSPLRQSNDPATSTFPPASGQTPPRRRARENQPSAWTTKHSSSSSGGSNIVNGTYKMSNGNGKIRREVGSRVKKEPLGVCNHCRQPGHKQHECPRLSPKSRGKGKDSSSSSSKQTVPNSPSSDVDFDKGMIGRASNSWW